MGQMRILFTLLEKIHETRSHKWKNNSGVYLKGTGCEGVAWSHVAEDGDQWRALVSKVVNFRVE